MKKYILIFALLLPIIFYFTPDIFAQTTEQNQNTACNNKANGQDCSYKVQLSGRDPEATDTVGKCDRRGNGILYCNSQNKKGWEDCFDRSQPTDACKTSDDKLGSCQKQGSGNNFTCDATKPPAFTPNSDSLGAPTISCVANAEKDNKCGTGDKCTGGQVCANVDGTVKCVANVEKDNKCGAGDKCTGGQVCVTQSAKVDTASTGTSSSSTSSSSATTTAGTVSYQSYTNFPGVGRISNLCQLITALWYLGFAVLLTSVLGMFLWGGYIYVTAGVNAGKVNQAKEIFTNTITGLIIGLSIFIIINVINPGLLQGNCSIPPIGSTGTGGGQPTLGGPGTSVPGNRNCDGCVSLRSQGVTVANWNGTNGPGRTDKVLPQVAAATKKVQDEMASLGIPIHITAAWTNGVGHSSGSKHYQGLAVDMQAVSGTGGLQQIANACRKAGFTFVLVESYHTHCDMR